jgi:hypothetical protein
MVIVVMGFLPDRELLFGWPHIAGSKSVERNIIGLVGRCLCHSCLKTKVETRLHCNIQSAVQAFHTGGIELPMARME